MSLLPSFMNVDEELFSPRSLKIFKELDNQLEKIVEFKYSIIAGSEPPISKEEIEKTKAIAIDLIGKIHHPLFRELKQAVQSINPNDMDSFANLQKVLEKI